MYSIRLILIFGRQPEKLKHILLMWLMNRQYKRKGEPFTTVRIIITTGKPSELLVP